MMTNLFSTFDPATSVNFSLNWMSTMIVFLMLPSMYWLIPTRYNAMMNMVMEKLHSEFKMLMSESKKGFTLMFVSLFMFILFNNLMGLLPYIFTSSSHLTFTMTMALPIWLSLMVFGWTNKTQDMFAHLIPVGTPPVLMPFMVLIETISNLIRPGSLAVRLTANMIAGHLLMSLLGNNMTSATGIIIPILMLVQMMLMLFETAVAIIQAYVFSVLSTLYTSEVA
uniref:ATP synthase subunit a n=1 Tax=Notonecta montandoni TaxID=2707887 RepID=A0A6C0R1J3_9HEMI|nr:ATP synthase F0 subunit 6 [Notonecta montandoni]QHZ87284.1 ATP synthase F0 subunit 6 [Notonecta montandoni]